MEYLTWGRGPKTLLFVQGGPGSVVPQGMLRGLFRREFAAYLEAGYAVWIVTRRRNMPASHTSADMADDYAQLIAEEFGGRVDLVVAESFGGMIGQYLAARHPESFGHIAMVVTAAELSAWGKDVDERMAAAVAAGDPGGAGTVLAEYLLPGPRTRWLRELLGPVVGRRVLDRSGCPAADVLTEARAELRVRCAGGAAAHPSARPAALRRPGRVLPEDGCGGDRATDSGLHPDRLRAMGPHPGRIQQAGAARRPGLRPDADDGRRGPWKRCRAATRRPGAGS